MGDFTDKYQALCAPFAVNVVKWRVGSVTKDGKKGTALAYIDARDVLERLDAVIGPTCWQRRYSHVGGITVCEIGVRIGDEWVWKSDGAGASQFEAEKGALSDAFKRAAVNWGIGRYLYDLPAAWVEIDERKRIRHGEMDLLRQELRRLNDGNAMPEPSSEYVAQTSSAEAKRSGRWNEIVSAVRNSADPDMAKEAVSVAYADEIASWPEAHKRELRQIYAETLETLRAKQAT